jgi:hypothetical protein
MGRRQATPTAGATLRSETIRRPFRIHPQDARRVRPEPPVPAPRSAPIAATGAASAVEARTRARQAARGRSWRPRALATRPPWMRAVRVEVTRARRARAAAGRPNAASAYPTRAASSARPPAPRARPTAAPDANSGQDAGAGARACRADGGTFEDPPAQVHHERSVARESRSRVRCRPRDARALWTRAS